MEGELPIAKALFSDAGLAAPTFTLLLHFGQRILKGRAGAFVSSIWRRDEQLGQTIIMAFALVVCLVLLNQT